MKLRKFVVPLLIILAAIAVFVGLKKTRPGTQPIEVKEKAWVVAVEEVRPARRSPGITLYGKVESLWSSILTAGISADVIAVEVIEGSRVSKGDLLVQLDDRDARLELLQRQAEVEEVLATIASQEVRHETDLNILPREKSLQQLTLNEVERLQALVSKKVSARSALDSALQAAERQAIAVTQVEQAIHEHRSKMRELQAKLGRAEALQQKAALELERTRVNAPFNGSISRVLVSPGRRVRSGDSLLEIFDTDALVFRAVLPNRHIPAIKRARAAGQDLAVQGEIDNEAVTARLLSLTARVDEGSGGVEGLFAIHGDGAALQQGRLSRLILELPPMDGVIALPHEAIYGTGQVYRLNNQHRLELLSVEKLGETRADGENLVLIHSGELQPGERILATQLPNAVDGLLVRIAGEQEAETRTTESQ